MITAIDTNILLDILAPDAEFMDASLAVLEEAARGGSMIVCDQVYAELCVHFASQRECDEFLRDAEIRVEALSPQARFAASRAWRAYRKQGGQRTRMLADFLIGAHAQLQADRLLSRDRGFYRKLFPSLKVLDPAGLGSRQR